VPLGAFPVAAYWSYGETCPMSYVADSSPDSCCAPTASYAPSDSIHHDRRQVDRRVQPPGKVTWWDGEAERAARILHNHSYNLHQLDPQISVGRHKAPNWFIGVNGDGTIASSPAEHAWAGNLPTREPDGARLGITGFRPGGRVSRAVSTDVFYEGDRASPVESCSRDRLALHIPREHLDFSVSIL